MSDHLRETLAAETVVDGRYRVLQRLGSGGMADVYLAEDLQLGRQVALKLLHRRFAEDSEFVERFRREASAAAGLQHPNVVQVFDRGEWDGTYYIAMEYLRGRSLKQIIIDEGPLDPTWAVDVALNVLRAARFAHKRGVIHRDIKPHNVIVDDEGRVKVTDFGIARAGASDMTETGAIMGTAQYLSPEQAQGHPVSASADLYSIGIVVYEMLTGRVPFEAESAVTIALKQVNEDPVPIRAINPDVSPQLEDVVLTALRKNPSDRFIDADDFIAALDEVRDLPADPDVAQRTGRLTGVYPAVDEDYTRAYDPVYADEQRSRSWLLVLLAALGLLAVAVGAWLLFRTEERPVPRVVLLTSDAAAAALNNAGFEVEIEEVTSADVPRDRVTRQRPSPGERADEGSTVTIFVSAGPGERTVPDVLDRPLREADRLVRQRGFRVQVKREFDETVKSGRVIEMLPPPRSQLEVGRTVTLVVSRGRERVTVPDVTDLDRDEARSRLEALDLQVTVDRRETESESPGTVLEQSPAAGTEVEKGSTVTITIAEEPSEVAVPDVEGAQVNDAIDALTEAGFRVRQATIQVEDPDEHEIVVEQRPAPGTKRKKGSRVTIFVGDFNPPLDPDPDAEPTPTP